MIINIFIELHQLKWMKIAAYDALKMLNFSSFMHKYHSVFAYKYFFKYIVDFANLKAYIKKYHFIQI
jgi:hypothetical protein